MKHEDVWRAIDTLAAENGLSASGLAKRSGLDATTFNPSKRRMPDGRARWPSTESVSKVLDADGGEFGKLLVACVWGARSGDWHGKPGGQPAGAADWLGPGWG